MASAGELEAVAVAEGRPLGLAAVGRGVWWFTRRKPLGAFGGLIMLAMIVAAIGAPVIAPYHYADQSLAPGERLQGPSLTHPLGTDQLGRDVLSRIIYGARVSVTIGFGAVAIASVLATAVGVLSGYYGGKIDTFAQRLVDIAIAFPGLILLIFLISVIGQGINEIMIAIGVLIAPAASRVVRGAVIAIKNNQYVEAARTIGASDARILLSYIVPNVLAIIIVGASIQVGLAILAESSLSFLGFGPVEDVTFPTWGRMLGVEGRQYMVYAPGLAVWPGVAIALAVFGFNMFGDALRDVLDPRLRGSR